MKHIAHTMRQRPSWSGRRVLPGPVARRIGWGLLLLGALLLGSTRLPGAPAGLPAPGRVAAPLCQAAARAANPVQVENTCPGSSGWRVDRPLGPQHAIEGFTSPLSVQLAGVLKLYVSTTAPTYTFAIYRMGWYGGLGGRLLYASAPQPGIAQPPPRIDPLTRLVECANWRAPVQIQLPANWVSGFYVIKLLAGPYMRYAFFVLRNDASHAAILFQSSVLTYEAYNAWGGYSLYGASDHRADYYQRRAYAVSFDRPFERGDGLGDFPLFGEYNLVRWLERSGYDLAYTTDIDTDQSQAPLLHHRLLLVAGHDEYWSTAMRAHVSAARAAGIALAFFGSNDGYWHVRLQGSALGAGHVLVCYKVDTQHGDPVVDPQTASDPASTTTFWRAAPLNLPENALLGGMHAGIVVGSAPLVLTAGSQPFFAGTPLHAGSAINGLVGGEYDRVFHNAVSPRQLIVLAHSPVQAQSGKDSSDATLYTAASGAHVFNAGTFYWAWGLDDDSFEPAAHLPAHHYALPAFRRFTANLLAYLL